MSQSVSLMESGVSDKTKVQRWRSYATLMDYTSKVRRHIIAELGDKRMGEVSLDDIQLALVPVSKKSASVYKSVVILYKSIFRAVMESRIIDHNPTIYLTTKGGGVPQEDRQALTDEQAARLLDVIRDLPPYVFVMIGLYAGLRREEILALQWDSVYLVSKQLVALRSSSIARLQRKNCYSFCNSGKNFI